MTSQVPKSERRVGVVVNYLCVAAIAVLVHTGQILDWDVRLRLIAIAGTSALGIVTFARVYWRTRLWQLAHASFAKLDERQVEVMYESLRRSYQIFALLCLIVVYVNAVAERGHVPILVAGSILYGAHTLPAAVLAWTEKEILAAR